MLLVIQILYILSTENNIYEIMLCVKPHCTVWNFFAYFFNWTTFSTMETAGQATVKFKE